jgi:hypothetical protein
MASSFRATLQCAQARWLPQAEQHSVALNFFAVSARVARFFWVQNTKTEKIYQITTNYTKCP